MLCLGAWREHDPVSPNSDVIRRLSDQTGVFETMACVNQTIPLWDAHWRRISQAAHTLSLKLPTEPVLTAQIARISQAHPNHVIKLFATTDHWFVTVHPFPDYPAHYWEEGISVVTCKTRLSPLQRLSGAKCIERGQYQQAAAEFAKLQVQEGILLGIDDTVIEGTKTNVFAVFEGVLWTPALAQQGVVGVARSAVLADANTLGIPICIDKLSREVLDSADELFLTNALIGIWPIAKLDGKTFSIGPMTRRLMKNMRIMHGCSQTSA